MSDDEPPELRFAEPDDGPRVSEGRQRVFRIVALVAVAALVLPGVIGTVSVQVSTAERACAIVVSALDPGARASSARFELDAPGGPGWYCYAEQVGGGEVLLRPLGLIPGLG